MNTGPYINTGNLSEDELAEWLRRLAKGRGHIDYIWAYELEKKMLTATSHAREALGMIETKLSALQSGEFRQSETLTRDIQKDIDILEPLAVALERFSSDAIEQLEHIKATALSRLRERSS
ncbi:hypothetical protein [Xenorhabdus bovienii]|uniref:hypothetical protein n=1 Tax=Xenorhabdus bovienii TaxID=40576 RepID=UPI00237C871D|nr:hypothetical protein [Xenorhabdus bovienii]MDE1492982.1 hypothetical protein [Xenorhabdus bovienii]